MKNIYTIGFNPLIPAEVVKAHERGLLSTLNAYEILNGLLDGHDHKESCDCRQYHLKLKELGMMLEDEVHELEINSVVNY